MDDYTILLQKLIPELVNIFHRSVFSIVLYGSVAKGTQTLESDIDIAVIVKFYTKEMREKMMDVLVDFELRYDKVISVLLIDYDKFQEWEDVMPFYRNIKQEGITLWPAA